MAMGHTGTDQEMVRVAQNMLKSVRAVGEAIRAVKVPTSPQLARAAQAAENSLRALNAEFGLLPSTQIARELGSRAENPRPYVSELRDAGELLHVRWGKKILYPRFQVSAEGEVLPIVRQLTGLAANSGWSPTELVLWLCAPTGWLADRRPVDVLATDPDAVVSAAESEFATEW